MRISCLISGVGKAHRYGRLLRRPASLRGAERDTIERRHREGLEIPTGGHTQILQLEWVVRDIEAMPVVLPVSRFDLVTAAHVAPVLERAAPDPCAVRERNGPRRLGGPEETRAEHL